MFFSSEQPDYLKTESLSEKWKQPDFNAGVKAYEAAKYFESRGDVGRADEIRKIQEIAKETPVYFVLAPTGIAAYVTPWSSKAIYYNLETLRGPGNPEHIIAHEKKHLAQQKDWGNTDVPGWNRIPQEVKALFAKELGTALDATSLLEGLTEDFATKKTRFDPSCSYNAYEVPLSERLNQFVLHITGVSLMESFGNMSAQGSRGRFETAMLQTANYLVLENAAENIVGNTLTFDQQKTVRTIGNDAVKYNHIIKPEEAKSILFQASVGILKNIERTNKKVKLIIGMDGLGDRGIIEAGLSVKHLSEKEMEDITITTMSAKEIAEKNAIRIIGLLIGGSQFTGNNQSGGIILPDGFDKTSDLITVPGQRDIIGLLRRVYETKIVTN